MNLIELRRQVEAEFPEFRKIWIETSRFNSLCITLFPLTGDYRIITADRLSEINFDVITSIIMENL